MARKPNKRQRANARLREIRAVVTALPPGVEDEPRVPLVGFESLYEITRSGHVYSRTLGRFIKHRHLRGSYIGLEIGGETINLNIEEAVQRSWAGLSGTLFRVDILGREYVVYATTVDEARRVALDALREEVAGHVIPAPTTVVTGAAEVSGEWLDAMPHRPEYLEEAAGELTVAQLLRVQQSVSAGGKPSTDDAGE
jgi:hypothetical protein